MEKKIVNNKIRKNGRPKGLTLGQILTWSVGEFHVYVGPNKWRTFKTKYGLLPLQQCSRGIV